MAWQVTKPHDASAQRLDALRPGSVRSGPRTTPEKPRVARLCARRIRRTGRPPSRSRLPCGIRPESHPREEVFQQDAPRVPLVAAVDEVRRHREVGGCKDTDLMLRSGVGAAEADREDRVLPACADKDRLTL